MKKLMLGITLLFCASAYAKLPPLSDEAKLKAAEAKQKTAHGEKTAAFQLCKVQDSIAARYRKGAKDAGAVVSTPKCEDPGPFVFVPPEAAPAPAAAAPAAPAVAAAAAAAPAAPAAAPAAPAKK